MTTGLYIRGLQQNTFAGYALGAWGSTNEATSINQQVMI
jgi:hypothetical protein